MRAALMLLPATALLLLCITAYCQPLLPPTPTNSTTRRITLAWDHSPGTNVARYKLYWGTNSRAYIASTNTTYTNQWTFTVPRVSSNYFTATAVDRYGLESDYSNEAKMIRMPNNKTNLVVSVFGKDLSWSFTEGKDWWCTGETSVTITNPKGCVFWKGVGATISYWRF